MLLELHSHTDHSRGKKIYYDGVSTPEEMVIGAKKAGLDGIFITDHDKISGALAARKYAKKHGVKVFVGEEVETTSGHVLGLGIQEKIKPGMTVAETIDAIHKQGGISVAVHPFDIRRAGIGDEFWKCDAVEVFNSMCLDRYSNNKCLKRVNSDKPLVAGSDAHFDKMIGYGQVEVKSNDLDGILKDIKKGKIIIKRTEYVPINVILNMSLGKLRKSYDHTNMYIDKNYSCPKKQIARSLLSLVNRDTYGLGSLYKFLALVAYGSVIVYGQTRRIF